MPLVSALLPLVLLLPRPSRGQTPPEPSGDPLRDLALGIPRTAGGSADASLRVGYASMIGFATDSDFDYEAAAAREFDILTPENDMKMSFLRPSRDVFDFGPANGHVDFAEANGMAVHGHALVWHQQNPAWVTDGVWDRESLLEVMREHIEMVAGHYAGRVAVWDVVNEAFADDGSFRQDSVWWQNIGDDYVELAFEYAALADPAASLIINDYSVENINAKSTGMYNLAVDLLSKGIPLHGVGFQCHLTNNGVDNASFAQNMQRFADLGLDIYLTELDVRISDNGNEGNLLAAQADVYDNVVRVCLEQPKCMAVQTWGFTDRYSWIPSFFQRMGRALPFDDAYVAKPAYYAVQAVLEEFQGVEPPPPPPPPSGPTARVANVVVEVNRNKPNRKQARARVKVVDENGAPLAGAVVQGEWRRVTTDLDSSTTASDGWTENMYSDGASASGTFEFCVTSVLADGKTYDESANDETCDSVTMA